MAFSAVRLIKRWMRTALPVLLFFLLGRTAHAQFYNGSQMTFGKSRVQYNDFLWTYYRFTRFDVYFYLNGKELATYTAEYADKHIKDIEMELEANLEEKIQFIVFNNLSDLKQSNIGQTGDWDSYNTGGVTRIVGGKVLIYFDGDYNHFEQQIRAGIAQVILNEMIYGAGIGAQIKNNALFSMPEWYLNGLISYVSKKWNPEIENQVKDAVMSGKYDKFNRLTGIEAAYAGHSLWYYISLKYGDASIPAIVYMARLSRNIEKGFMYVLGVNFKDLISDWLKFYTDLYSQEMATQEQPQGFRIGKKNKSDLVYRQMRYSPDSNLLAFCSHELGVYKVFLNFRDKGKIKKIYRGGYRIAEKTDYSYPLLAWHPSGRVLAMIVERKGEICLYFYRMDEKKFEKQILYDFQKVLDFSYSDDGSLLVMSAVQRGQSDIFVFNIASGSYQQITRDAYNDFNPRFVNHSKDIIFSSNRITDTIRFDEKIKPGNIGFNNDLFLYNYSSGKRILHRITHTPLADDIQPMPYEDNFFCYLSDGNGIYNRYLARFDSAISYIDTATHYRYYTTSYPVTNYTRNILEQDAVVSAGRVAEIVFINQKYNMLGEEMLRPKYISPVRLEPTNYNRILNRDSGSGQAGSVSDSTGGQGKAGQETRKKHFTTVRVTVIPPPLPAVDTLKSIPAGPGMQMLTIADQGKPAKKDSADKYEKAKQLNYNVEYSIDQLVTQIDFNYLNWSYQPFTGSKAPIFINPGFNALFMVGITDLMEDHKITGGVRLDFNLVNNEYLLSYMNLKRRLDHQVIFHRQSVEDVTYYSYIRHKINELYYIATYPFNPVLNIKGTASLRYDKAVFLSTDMYNLQQPDIDLVWGSVKGDLTYDNTRSLGLNLYRGTRYKIFAEYYQQLNATANNMIVVGADFRHYIPIHRTMILALRLAGSTSFGQSKLIYYMGGVDNWLWPVFDQNIPVSPTENYAFQTLATNMRGFPQNIRNGNSFVLLNAEVRLPVFRYFYNRPIRSDFINNFQIVAFGDAGTAWTGPTPYSEENTLFTRYIYRDPLFIKVQLLRDPFVEGVGFGIRSRILGYFVRGDVAWGLEDGYWRQPVYYLSLSLDF